MNPSLCESCVLPDCDSASKRCLLRRAFNRVNNLRQRGRADEITDADRDGCNEFYLMWRDERAALLSEGSVQPKFSRKATPSPQPESQTA